jgi:hypothetical protein
MGTMRPDIQANSASFGLSAGLLLCLGLCGCGGAGYEHAEAHGEVKLDGQPVTKGSIKFTPLSQGQGPVVGGEIVDGQYRCERVPLGNNRVTFNIEGGTEKVYDAANDQWHEVPKPVQLSAEDANGHERQIQSGDNELDFDLKSRQ